MISYGQLPVCVRHGSPGGTHWIIRHLSASHMCGLMADRRQHVPGCLRDSSFYKCRHQLHIDALVSGQCGIAACLSAPNTPITNRHDAVASRGLVLPHDVVLPHDGQLPFCSDYAAPNPRNATNRATVPCPCLATRCWRLPIHTPALPSSIQ